MNINNNMIEYYYNYIDSKHINWIEHKDDVETEKISLTELKEKYGPQIEKFRNFGKIEDKKIERWNIAAVVSALFSLVLIGIPFYFWAESHLNKHKAP